MTAGSGVPMAAKRSTKGKRATNSRPSRANMTQQGLAGMEVVEPAELTVTDPPARTSRRAAKSSANGNGSNIGFEAKLWLMSDKLRNNMDAAEYKHVVLGLIFLKY